MDLLIATCLARFRGQAARASLGLAPLAGATLPSALRARVPAVGLESFKGKFAPCWEPRSVAFERLLDLPAVMLALVLLHYPRIRRRHPNRSTTAM
jgi:lysylphosphatidylglycerol synthetase-like protein (DUF2156 family)